MLYAYIVTTKDQANNGADTAAIALHRKQFKEKAPLAKGKMPSLVNPEELSASKVTVINEYGDIANQFVLEQLTGREAQALWQTVLTAKFVVDYSWNSTTCAEYYDLRAWIREAELARQKLKRKKPLIKRLFGL